MINCVRLATFSAVWSDGRPLTVHERCRNAKPADVQRVWQQLERGKLALRGQLVRHDEQPGASERLVSDKRMVSDIRMVMNTNGNEWNAFPSLHPLRWWPICRPLISPQHQHWLPPRKMQATQYRTVKRTTKNYWDILVGFLNDAHREKNRFEFPQPK